MVPTCPFPGRLAPSSTATEVPTCASRDSKMFTPCRSLFGARPHSPEKPWNLTPTALPFPARIYSRMLHLFMYCGALSVQQHLGKGLHPLHLCNRHGSDIGGVNTSTYTLNISDSHTTKPFEYVVRFCQSKRVNVSECAWSYPNTTAPTPVLGKNDPRPTQHPR
jgi:hypothetical protein